MAYSLQDSYEAATEYTSQHYGGDGDRKHMAFSFVGGADYTLTAVEIQLRRYGSLTGKTFTVSIYSATATPGLPSTLLGTATNTIDADSFATDALTWSAKATFAGVSVVSGTHYFINCTISAVGDAANYATGASAFNAAYIFARSPDASTWTSMGSRRHNFRTYSGSADGATVKPWYAYAQQ